MKFLLTFIIIAASSAAAQDPATTTERVLYKVDSETNRVVVAPPFDAKKDVFFMLYTRRNPTVGQRIGLDAEGITKSNWNISATGTRFIIHGFNNYHGSPVNVLITKALLTSADHNVVSNFEES